MASNPPVGAEIDLGFVDEVVARLETNWSADVKAYDHAYDHILKMSDALADGIAKQFPGKVTAEK